MRTHATDFAATAGFTSYLQLRHTGIREDEITSCKERTAMNTILRKLTLAVLGIVLISCGTVSKDVRGKSISQRNDIFSDASEGTPPQGLADLTIRASIKTPLEGYYLLDSKASLRGKPGCPVVFNIDGQAVTGEMNGEKEGTPKYDKDGKTSHDPEAGEGMKYRIEKKIRLTSGPHKIFFGLPGEDYFTSAEVSLKDGETHYLEFIPVYKYKTHPHRIPTFLKGVKEYAVLLNGEQVN